MAQKFLKSIKILTLNDNFEGLPGATELEQSSHETLDHLAHLSCVRVLNSQQFKNSGAKRFGTLPKKINVTKLHINNPKFQFQYASCICMCA